MLSEEAAKAALAERREQSARSRRRLSSAIARGASGFGDHDADPEAVVKRLDRLGRRGRRAAFGAVCPGLAAELEALYENAAALTYSQAWDRRPFRAPSEPRLARERIVREARRAARELAEHAADPVWLARWAGYVGFSSHLTGWLLTAAIDAGNDEVFDILLATIDGSDEVASFSYHVPIALLGAGREEGWQRIEELLLAAGRQEGLRQGILEVADEARPEAFRRILALILENGLSRFAAVVRAAAVWFGLEALAGDRRRVDGLIERALGFLTDAEGRRRAIEAGPPIDAYLALWAEATEDVLSAVALGEPLLEDPEAERRMAAVWLISQTQITGPAPLLLRTLADDDLRVAALGTRGLAIVGDDVLPPSYDEIEALLARVPKRAVKLEPVEWLGGELPSLKREEVAGLLFRHTKPPQLDRVLPHARALSSWHRRELVGSLGATTLTPDRRDALLGFLADPSSDVRERAIVAAGEIDLYEDEARALEPLLRRKAGDLRRGLIELILKRGERWALDAAERLLASGDAQQRLAGVELLRRVAAGNAKLAGDARMRLEQLEAEDDAPAAVAEAARSAVADEVSAVSDTDGFGLFHPRDLTPPSKPQRLGFKTRTPAARRTLALLDALVEEHSEVEVQVLRPYGSPERVLLGAAGYLNLRSHLAAFRSGETEIEPPMLEQWDSFARDLPPDAHDSDGQQLLRALLDCEETTSSYRWDERAKAAHELGVRHLGVVTDVLELLALALTPDEHTFAAALDAAEDALARLSRKELIGRHTNYSRPPHALEAARQLATRPEAAASRDLLARHWRLERWLSEPFDGGKRLPARPPCSVVVNAFEHGVASEADLIDDLVGPRPSSHGFGLYYDLSQLSTRRGRAGRAERTAAVVERVRERIVEIELARGETPTAAAGPVRALQDTGGLDVLVRALAALGREKFVRGWTYDGDGRRAVFSHMVAASQPRENDTPERFAEAVREAKIPARRLRETACYAPQWAAHVEAALDVPGLADAVWWLHAHTKDDRWSVDSELKSQWESAVADRTDLSSEELVDGAVDVAWFLAARERVGDEELDELLTAAKYGSTSGGHKRAELFAQAIRGVLSEDELLTRIGDKRHQDPVRALGLLPLPDDQRERATTLARRYEALQEFRRGSRQFGRQRQASEGRATDIGMENLARTAGFTDPVRLTWAMEAAATADLAGGRVSHTHDGATVTLSVEDHGRPQLSVRREGGKALKSVPAKLRKVPEIKALSERATTLRRQSSRIRTSLEQALLRGDVLTGAELARYREHVLLWPSLSRLVLVGEGTAGFPGRDGRVLRDHAGTEHAVGDAESLRIAHPLDLLERGDWPEWQREVLASRIVQPCKQVFREVYMPVDAERTDAGGSRRYAGHQLQPAQARALLAKRGWRIDEYEGVRRTDHREHVSATLWFLDGFGSPLDVEPPTLEEVRFQDVRNDRPLPLDEVPPRLFSEVMRDVDLVVSVAHVGGVDPEASQSSLEMRGALVRETCDLLGRDNVTVEGPRAMITGEIGRYSVHLGSGGVHQLPGGAVCIVPVHAQHRGRVFLPFADDDPKTAEIVAKVLMLSRDRDIRDPTILEQLRA